MNSTLMSLLPRLHGCGTVSARLAAVTKRTPVAHQNVAGEEEEQHHRLEDARRRIGNVHGRLRHLPADIGDGQHDAGEEHAQRMQPPEERDDDRGEAVVGRESRASCCLNGPGQFQHAGEPGHAAADQQRQPDRLACAENPPWRAALRRRCRPRGSGSRTPSATSSTQKTSAMIRAMSTPRCTMVPGNDDRQRLVGRQQRASAGSCAHSGPSTGRRPDSSSAAPPHRSASGSTGSR